MAMGQAGNWFYSAARSALFNASFACQIRLQKLGADRTIAAPSTAYILVETPSVVPRRFSFAPKQSTPRAAFSSRIGFPLTCYEPKTRVRQHLTLHSWKRSLPLLATTLWNKLRFSPFPAIGLVSLLLVEVLRWIENGQFIKTQTKRSTIIFFVHSVHFGNHSAQRNDLTGAGFAFQRFNC
jgi:hypothetical protein